MKKLYLTLSLSFFGCYSNAQQIVNFENIQKTEVLIGADQCSMINHKISPSAKTIWGVQLLADITTNTGSNGQAGIAFFNNEFWTSRWASDTIIRYTNTGGLIQKFQIPGVTGIRSITTDGTFLYMGNASTTIYIVNPSTQLLTGTITTTNTARFLTFDPTLNGGAGGFWMGSFGSSIDAIAMNGSILSSIPNSLHTLTGMYGAAVDNFSPNGPYLWVHNQGGANSDQFVAIELSTGTPSIYSHDVFPDLASLGVTSSLAGGAFLTNSLVPGQISLIGLTQSTAVNAIIAYELSINAVSIEIQATDLTSEQGYTKIPESQLYGQTFALNYANLSTQTLDSVVADFDFFYNGGLVQHQTFAHLSVASAAIGTFNSTTFNPSNGIGNYEVIATLRTETGLTEVDLSNNTLNFNFEITDSTYARDNSIADATPYTVNTLDSSYIGSNFEIVATDTITGIWIQLVTPNDGDTTYPFLHNFNASLPSTPIAIGEITLINAMTPEYYLKFNDTIILTPGIYTFGCYQGVGNDISLAQSDNVFTPGTNYFYANGMWTQSGISTARFIRPIFGTLPAASSGITEQNQNEIVVYPNPANEYVSIKMSSSNDVTIRLIDLTGSILMQQKFQADTKEITLSVEQFNSGIYLMEIIQNEITTTKRLLIK